MGNVSPANSGKYLEILDHSLLFLQLLQILFVENSYQLGRCSTHLTSDFASSFFFPLSTSLPNSDVMYLKGGVYFYMWLLKRSIRAVRLGHFSENWLGAIL